MKVMDVFVCFWDIDRHKVSSQFYDSRFLGHTTHLDVLSSLEDSIKKIDTIRIIQVSMDGPNTNLKVLEEYQKKRVEDDYHNLLTQEHATSKQSMVYLRQELQKVLIISRNF